MAYVELDNVLFRGTLKGAKGEARFKLTVDAIDAVDTVNIGNNQVTYDFQVRYETAYQAKESVLITANINIPDPVAWVEIIAYGERAGVITVDGVSQPNRNRRGPGQILLPFVSMFELTQGQHTVKMISASAGASSGYVMCRYIRKTGS